MTDIQHLASYKATIKNRPMHKGCEVRPDVLPFEGKTYYFQAGWEIIGDIYHGEWAMLPFDDELFEVMTWIAHGDLTDIQRVTRQEARDGSNKAQTQGATRTEASNG